MTAPASGPPRVGRVVAVGTLLRRVAVAVGEHDGTVTLLGRGDTLMMITTERFDGLTAPPGPTAPVRGAAGRLWAAGRQRDDGGYQARWSPEAVDAAAVRAATASLGARRAAAIDLVTLGVTDPPVRLGLSETELTWYRAHGAALTGDLPAMLHHLEQLPAAGYPGRVALVLHRFGQLCAEATLAARASAVLEPLAADSLDATAMLAALHSRPTQAAVTVLVPYARKVDPARTAVAEAITNRIRMPQVPEPGPAVALWRAYCNRERLPSPDALATTPIPLLEAMVSRGVVTQAPEGGPVTASAAYLRCRLEPKRADAATLRTAGLVDELARREFLAGDDAQLATLPDQSAGVRHYRAMRAYLTSGRIEEDDLRPGVLPTVLATDQLALTFAGVRQASEPVAADPSTWRLLRSNAVEGRIQLDDELRRRYPQFGYWLLLCGLYRHLREHEWAEVVAVARQITTATPAATPHLRAEALNVLAYALWQQRHPREALAALDEALTLRPGCGLAVNAALVAGGTAALPHLARALRHSTEPAVRQALVTDAIDRWQATGPADRYPPVLAGVIRGELTTPQPDATFHRRLLVLALRHDRDWLVDAPPATVAVGSPAQVRAARYHQARAQVEAQSGGTALRNAATALVALWRGPGHRDWVAGERGWLVGQVVTALRDAGDDTGHDPLPAVDALLRGDLLDPGDRLALSALAGGYLAGVARRGDPRRFAEVERRLTWTCRMVRDRRATLDERARHQVEQILAMTVGQALQAVVLFTNDHHNQMVKRWNTLLRTPAADYAAGRRVREDQQQLLDEFAPYLDRCQAFLALTRGLPVDAQLLTQCRAMVDGWTISIGNGFRWLA